MSKNTFKISASYWNSLSMKEQIFLRKYACQDGVAYCKRILTLAKNFGDYSEIVKASEYYQMDDGIASMAYNSAYVILKSNNPIGLIQKSYDNMGISERIKVFNRNGWTNVWHNFYQKNPNKNLISNAIRVE